MTTTTTVSNVCLSGQMESNGQCFCPQGQTKVMYGSGCIATTVTCGCTEIFHSSNKYCIPCPDGYISDRAKKVCQRAESQCGPKQIIGGPDACYSCSTCPSSQEPAPDRRSCQMIIRTCSCTEKLSDDESRCDPCPSGEVTDPNDNKQCMPPATCTLSNQIFGNENNCYSCISCAPPQVPSLNRDECVDPEPPTCQCNERYNPVDNSCIPCPFGQVHNTMDNGVPVDDVK
jgi:hypothetical protein